MNSKPTGPAAIMIVDDNPNNLKLLEEMLQLKGHEVRSFPLARLALEAAGEDPPDLVLMDVNMPEMDGYEACRQLKTIDRLADVPVIFLSALNETADKVRAFQSGAVDYISKPFQLDEVQSRVQTQIDLHALHRALRTHNEQLEDAVAARTRQLADANTRLTILDRSKNDFLSLISHELRTPLNGLLGVSEIILAEMPQTKSTDRLQQMYRNCRARLLSILEDSLLLTEIDGNTFGLDSLPWTPLGPALDKAIERTAESAAARRIVVLCPATGPYSFAGDMVRGDEKLLVRALHALLETAVRFSVDGKAIRFVREASPTCLQVTIESEGHVLPENALEKFFDILAVREAVTPGGDLGLSPAVAHRILTLFGASVNVENRRSVTGVHFSVGFNLTLPA